MDRKQIESLEAGREMDLLVADVAGWDRKHSISECEDCFYDYCRNCGFEPRCEPYDDFTCEVPPKYSTDITAAWGVLMSFVHEGEEFPEDVELGWNGFKWFCYLNSKEAMIGHVTAPTAPLAICRAALVARNLLAETP